MTPDTFFRTHRLFVCAKLRQPSGCRLYISTIQERKDSLGCKNLFETIATTILAGALGLLVLAFPPALPFVIGLAVLVGLRKNKGGNDIDSYEEEMAFYDDMMDEDGW